MNTSKTTLTSNQILQQTVIDSTKAIMNHTILDFELGQLIKGSITDMIGNNIQIVLPDGQELHGSLKDKLPVSIGDQATFQVIENSEKGYVLKLIDSDSIHSSDPTIEKALTEANLPKSDRNYEIVHELLDQQMSIDKSSIQTIIRQAAQFRNASIHTIVVMNRYQLPMTQVTTTQFEAYQNFEYRLVQQVSSLTDRITELLTSSKDVTLPSVLHELNSFVSASSDFSSHNVPSVLPDSTTSTGTLQLLMETESFKNLHGVFTGTESFPQVLARLDLLMTSPETLPKIKENIGLLFREPLFKDYLKEQLIRKLTISPEQLAKKDSLSRFYETLEEDLRNLKASFSKETLLHTNSSTVIQLETSQLQDNIEFMKAINQLFGYIQLPLKLKEQLAHGELYVYTDKKKLSEGDGNISVLLHLSMENLGPLDFYITLHNHMVNSKITLQKEESLSFLQAHLPQLAQALEKKGYSFTYQLEQKEEETNPIRDYFTTPPSNHLMKRYTFDTKA